MKADSHKHMPWNNTRYWPLAHRRQSDAGLPDGPLLDTQPPTHWGRFVLGVLIGALIVGPGLADLWQAL